MPRRPGITITPGQAIHLGRIHAGFPRQSRLSEQLGWPVRLIHEFEVGHRRPSPEQLEILRSRLPLLDLLLKLARPQLVDVDEVVGRL
jgi:hypothetical protein